MSARIEIWRIALDRPAEGREAALSPDERERAARFHFERDRRRFIVAHAALRAILQPLAGRAAAELRFSTGPRGKPALDGGPSFNLSHSGDRALAAVTAAPGRALGVDLEEVRGHFDHQEVAKTFFSPRERASLAAVAPDQRAAAFFRGWTHKEAYIKAKGDGLYLPLDSFDVALAPGEPARLIATRPDGDEAARYHLHDLDGGAGYAAALCVAGRSAPEDLIYCDFEERA